jgi:hypothetical protein
MAYGVVVGFSFIAAHFSNFKGTEEISKQVEITNFNISNSNKYYRPPCEVQC